MQIIQSPLFSYQKKILHAFTTRNQGQRSGPFLSNNLAFHVGDNNKNILANHTLLARELDYELEALVHMRQIHSDRVLIVNDKHSFLSPPECDALITNIPNQPIMVMTADCTPVLLYDPHKKVIAAIHAGRAGAFKNIVAKSIKSMQRVFESNPTDIIAVLGPSIGVCCYEVDKMINEEAQSLKLRYAMQENKGHYFLNVNAIIHQQLYMAGVPKKQVDVITRCSSCENSTFFSYRAEGQKTGRMAGVIMMRS